MLRGRAEASLLAILALTPGRVVSTSRLVDDLWDGEAVPADPVNALHLRVSKVRRALAHVVGDDLLQRSGAGYVLSVPPGCVDVHRFTEAVALARACGDPGSASQMYEQALTLWRGRPLEDFAGSRWAEVEAGRLEELRYAAIAEQADRLLTLGRFEDAVATLQPAVTADATRERLVAQLMIALFNAGRQAEALEAFARTRKVLAEQLGVDPSRDLRAVMEQILRHDPAIARRPEATLVRAWFGDGESRRPVSRAAAGGPGTLPRRRTSFVGRAADLERTGQLVRPGHLVTLIGPGGAGKTTLAIEVARSAGERFQDGAWFVRLAPLTNGAAVAHAVADALGLSLEGGTAARRPLDVLTAHLADRELLLVLDNAEHVIEAVAVVADAVLDRCPGVAVLATSREALATPDEVQVVVPPLPVPHERTPPQDLTSYPAVQLFLDRVQSTSPDRELSPPELQDVAAICRRLDGIPLAIELAAACASNLSTAELADRVRDRFGLLTNGSRTAEARQQTLRAAVDWSHDMLSEPEQVLFRRLAVFRGGWNLAAAEAILPGGCVTPEAVLGLLGSLCSKSLIAAEPAREHTRYRMLETLRHYAQERLTDAPAERSAVAGAHAAYFTELAEQAEWGLRGPGQTHWVALLRRDSANLLAALDWLRQPPADPDRALRLAGSLGLYWHMGRHLEGRRVIGEALALPGGSAAARGRALQALSLVERPRACIVHPSEQCAAAARHSAHLLQQAGDHRRAALSRLLLAVEGVGSDPQGEFTRLLAAADADFSRLDDAWGRAVAAFVRMEICIKRGDETSARAAADRAVARFRALDDAWGLSGVLYHYGAGLQRFAAHGEAVTVLTEAVEVASAAGVHNTVQWATADLALSLMALGRLEDAAEQLARAGAASLEVGDDAGLVLGRYAEALLAERRGEQAVARELFTTAHHGFTRLGVSLATGLALAGVARCAAACGDLPAARAAYADLIDLAGASCETSLLLPALEGQAAVSVADDPVSAAELLGRATQVRERLDRPRTHDERAAVDKVMSRALAATGPAQFEAAFARGRRTAPTLLLPSVG